MIPLPLPDQKNINHLYSLSEAVLKELGVDYTHSFLKKHCKNRYIYHFLLNQQPPVSVLENKRIDSFSAVNLAYVLMDILSTYQVKSVVDDGLPDTKITTPLLLIKVPEAGSSHLDNMVLTTQSSVSNYSAETLKAVILFEKTSVSAEPKYSTNKQTSIAESTTKYALLSGFILLIGLAFYTTWQQSVLFAVLPLVLIYVAGIFVCYQLFFIEKTGSYQSKLVQKFCTAGKSSGCQSVVQSGGSKLWGNISFTDIGSVFFSGNLLAVLFAMVYSQLNNLVPCQFWLVLASLPFSVYAIYYQVKTQQFCKLCMVVQAMLWILFSYLFYINTDSYQISFQGASLVVLPLISTAAIYYFGTTNFLLKKELFYAENELEGIKNTEGLFDLMLQRHPAFTYEPLPGDIVLGNTTAKVNLLFIMSSSCKLCAEKPHDITTLNEWFGEDIGITVHMVASEHSPPLLKEIIPLTVKNDHKAALKLVADWYKNPDKSSLSDVSTEVENTYQICAAWYKKYPVPTPSVFYNGRMLPPVYSDINVLKSQIEKELE